MVHMNGNHYIYTYIILSRGHSYPHQTQIKTVAQISSTKEAEQSKHLQPPSAGPAADLCVDRHGM